MGKILQHLRIKDGITGDYVKSQTHLFLLPIFTAE